MRTTLLNSTNDSPSRAVVAEELVLLELQKNFRYRSDLSKKYSIEERIIAKHFERRPQDQIIIIGKPLFEIK